MTSAPRYNFPPRTEIILARRPVIFVSQTEHGYEVMDSENGAISIVPYSTFVEMLRLPGSAINTTPSTTGSRLETRLGGYKAWQALPSRQREIGEIRLALCRAMVEWRTKLRTDAGDPRLQLSGRGLDKPEAKEFIAEHASIALSMKIAPPRVQEAEATRSGGRSDAFILYKGRTLNELFR